MSTNALIKIDGSKDCIYSHWDGYPSYIGPILLKHFNKKRKVKKLLALGNISILNRLLVPRTKNHSFSFPDDRVTIAYHRDRGEEFAMGDNFSYDYFYIFKNGDWYMGTSDGRTLLRDIMKKNHE